MLYYNYNKEPQNPIPNIIRPLYYALSDAKAVQTRHKQRFEPESLRVQGSEGFRFRVYDLQEVSI